MTIDVASLEFEWGVDPEAICFFDETETVFASTRQSLLMHQAKNRDARTRALKLFRNMHPAVRAGMRSGHLQNRRLPCHCGRLW